MDKVLETMLDSTEKELDVMTGKMKLKSGGKKIVTENNVANAVQNMSFPIST
jgi:hypothetical protein